MNTEAIWTFLSTQGVDFGLKVMGAIAVWFIGRWVIKLITRLVGAGLHRNSKMDATLTNYLMSILGVVLNILLVLAVLDIFGVKTTSFAALLAGAGLAIGTAWGGLLTHFAAGVFMQVLRPYKVGDMVMVSGVTGTVKELGLFGTTIVTADNVTVLLGNNKIFSDAIHNYSILAHRRVDTTAKIANSVNVQDAIAKIKEAVAAVPNVMKNPPPSVEIIEFTPEGPKLCIRPYASAEHYGQVQSDTHMAIVETFRKAGYPIPETPVSQRSIASS
ncbi:MAG: mechanosensitive ion channel family protein [Comamonadaceae bacterium]|nr:MAG: mechanosensitive ion channel family protein [Comamonadaceae bacterium]